MPDGTPFDIPADSPMPDAIDVPDAAAGQIVWLMMPVAAPNTREVDEASADSASRYIRGAETFIDSTSALRIEEEIDIAYPRLSFELRKTAKPGYMGLGIARILEVRDKNILFDDKFVPPMLVCAAHPVIDGWLNRIIGWIETKLEELARYAVDPSSGGGPAERRLFRAAAAQPANSGAHPFPAIGISFIPSGSTRSCCGSPASLRHLPPPSAGPRDYPAYDHDDLENVFAPLVRDIQEFLSARLGRRAIRLEIIERAQNAFVSPIRDRSLFRNATFVLEVAARRPLVEIQNDFPHLFKVGPNTKMNEIVHANLPGLPLVHLPTPPPHIRAITDHVYFYLDRKSPLWPEFSNAASIGMHFSGDWPELELYFWAILEDRR